MGQQGWHREEVAWPWAEYGRCAGEDTVSSIDRQGYNCGLGSWVLWRGVRVSGSLVIRAYQELVIMNIHRKLKLTMDKNLNLIMSFIITNIINKIANS
jgi:hypothetical protein